MYKYKINITCYIFSLPFRKKNRLGIFPFASRLPKNCQKILQLFSTWTVLHHHLCYTEQEKSAIQVRLLQLAFWAWTLAAEGTWLSPNPVFNPWGIWDPFNSQSYHCTPQHITLLFKVIPTVLSTPMDLKLQNRSVQAILCPDIKTCTYIILSRKLKIKPNVSFCFTIKCFSRHL